jgi:hypothetical protein
VFTAAVSFHAGLLPGLLTALLTQVVTGLREHSATPFIICSCAEVVLIYLLNPVAAHRPHVEKNLVLSGRNISVLQKKTVASFVNIFAGLVLLYIVSCIAISVLGGLIDYIYHVKLLKPKMYFSAEDAFKIGLMHSGIPVPAVDILSRIPVNIVDRFIVIFSGFFVSLGLKKLKIW